MTLIGSLALVLAGLILLIGSMHFPLPAAAWIGLLLMMHGSRSVPSVAFWLAATVVLAVAERSAIPASGVGFLTIVALSSLTLIAPFAIDRAMAGQFASASVVSTLVFPLAFVAIEFLRSRVLPNATWGSIAYTQYGVLPLMQVAAFAGIWGIVFVTAWSASTFELAWRHGLTSTIVRVPLLTFLGVLGATMAIGALRLGFAPTDRPTIRAATINRPPDLFLPGEMTRITEGRVTPEDRPAIDLKLAQLQEWFLDGSRREAAAGARLVVWPEQNLLVFHENEAQFLSRARLVAAEAHVYLAMGLGTIHLGEPKPFENKLVLIDPAGGLLISYLKNHPVPGWEASIMRLGDGHLPVVATPVGRMATAICYDGSFPEFIRQAALGEADVLILPVNDFQSVRLLHFQMHAFRAIETGLPIVRGAASGISGAFDPWGRQLGFADYFSPGDRTLAMQVPIGGVRTIYARVGDAFAWICVTGLATVLGAALVAFLRR